MSRPSTARMFATRYEPEHKDQDTSAKNNNKDEHEKENVTTKSGTWTDRQIRPQAARPATSSGFHGMPLTARNATSPFSSFLSRFPDTENVPKSVSKTLIFLKASQENDTPKLMEMLRSYRSSMSASKAYAGIQPQIDINAVDDYDMSPFLYACKHGEWNVVDELLQFPNLKFGQKDRTGQNALMFACFHGHYKIVEAILERIAASTVASTNTSREYIISINARSLFGVSAIMKAVICPMPVSEPILEKLCAFPKAMLDISNTAGETAMQMAYSLKNIAKMKIMFAHGAKLDKVFLLCLRNNPLGNIVMFEEVLAFSGFLLETNPASIIQSQLSLEDKQILLEPTIQEVIQRANSRYTPLHFLTTSTASRPQTAS